MADKDTQFQIDQLTRRCEQLQHALGTFIYWTAQSSLGVISHEEAKRLHDIMTGKDKP